MMDIVKKFKQSRNEHNRSVAVLCCLFFFVCVCVVFFVQVSFGDISP